MIQYLNQMMSMKLETLKAQTFIIKKIVIIKILIKNIAAAVVYNYALKAVFIKLIEHGQHCLCGHICGDKCDPFRSHSCCLLKIKSRLVGVSAIIPYIPYISLTALHYRPAS